MSLPVVEAADQELVSYSYSYPHKSSYRSLDPPIPLDQVWKHEPRDQLALYIHVPFCDMRCGFCNLFTQSQPLAEFVDAYLATLRRQMRVVRDQVGPSTFRLFAVGGGTPTWLSGTQLACLLGEVERTFGFTIRSVPTSVETSPSTATRDRLQALAAFGVERISLGIQSFDAAELGRIGRPQRPHDVHRALAAIREARFSILNIDLIYGDPQQTVGGWLRSLDEALAYAPEEIYLYPLYVRPETGLGQI